MADTWEQRMAARAQRRAELARITQDRRERQERAAESAAEITEQEAERGAPPNGCEVCWEWSDEPDIFRPHLVMGWCHREPDRADPCSGYYLCACECHDGDLHVGGWVVIG